MGIHPVMTNNGTEIALAETVVQELRATLRGELLCPGGKDFDRVRQVWNGLTDKRPGLIVRCYGVADVIAAVNFARTYSLLVAVRGGGHNVAGYAVCDGGLMIDLSPMRGVRVDPEARTVRVQGGATWRDVDYETQSFGLAVPGGIISATGVAGLTLGGGYGWLRGKYGLTCDCLRSVDVVTADGQFVTASQDRDPDLFWGVRGGGGNFGIVTSFEFHLYPVGPQVVFCGPQYPAEEAPRLLRAWRDFMTNAPDEFTGEASLSSVGEHPEAPAELWGKKVIGLPGVYCGDLATGERFIQPLRTLSRPLQDVSGRLSYLQLQTGSDVFFPKGESLHYWKSVYLDQFSDEVIDLMIDWFWQCPLQQPLIFIRYLTGAVRRVAATETAFGDRSAQVLVSIDSTWQNPQESDRNIAWTRAFWAALQPYSSGKTYFNFPGLLEEGDQLVRTSFGANYERMVALKNKYDPTNLFRLNQNIQPTVHEHRGRLGSLFSGGRNV